MKKLLSIISLLILSTAIYAWVPSDFALLTWSLENQLSKPISDAIGSEYRVIVDESKYEGINEVSGHYHTYELIIVQGSELISIPKARVFLYIKDSIFDSNYSDEILDYINIETNDVTAKISCTGIDDQLVKIIKEAILNFDFKKYKANEL